MGASDMRRFAAITARYIDRPFERHTCMGVLHAIYSDLGVDVPDSWEELTLENYMDAYRRDPRGTQIRMLRLVRSLGRPASAQNPGLGDLLVVAQNPNKPGVVAPGFFPAIYTGRGQAITSFLRHGVSVFRLDKRNRPIAARRMF